jgi:glycosyltransferase involved in cell wall biosynthesis
MVEGGHMVIARSLVQALREGGHTADIVVTPQNRFGRQASAYVANWLTDVGTSDGRKVDQVISLRYPSYAVRHDNHVCWLNHTMREYYDLWPRFSASLSPRALVKERVRRTLMHRADRYLLGKNVRRLLVQSRTVQQRLSMWPEVHSSVLYPPAPQRAYRCDEYGDYIFMVSRLTPLKRVQLLIDALATPDGQGIQAVISGEGEDEDRLRGAIEQAGVADRVRLVGHLPDDGIVDHYARCRAVCFPPWQEDYGFVTVEAFASRKAVVTCTDSGGPAELVQHGYNGFVCDPEPAALARTLRAVTEDREPAARMGTAAYETGLKLNWPDAVRQLTA